MPTATADLVSLFVESDALRLAELVRQKEVTPAELTETAIRLIENLDPKLNAVVIRDFDRARARASETPPRRSFRRRTLSSQEYRIRLRRLAPDQQFAVSRGLRQSVRLRDGETDQSVRPEYPRAHQRA